MLTATIRIVWALAMAWALILMHRPGDIQFVGLYMMLALAFPVSVPVVALYQSLLHLVLPDPVRSAAVFDWLAWAILSAAGYCQWFVVVPWAVRRWRSKPDSSRY